MNPGAIVGVTVGSVFCFMLVAGTLVWAWRYGLDTFVTDYRFQRNERLKMKCDTKLKGKQLDLEIVREQRRIAEIQHGSSNQPVRG